MLTIDDDLRAAAAGERREAAIEPWAIADAATRWTEDVQRPFTRGNQAAVRAGGSRGDMVNRRLCQNVDREYSALRAPSRFDIETAAAALQLLGLPRGREPWGAPLIGAWVAHSGLACALEVFVKSLWNRACVIDRSTKARELKVVPQRTLDDMFAARSDRALHAAWLGATDEARAQARLKAEQLRQNGSLLVRSAIASCVLDPAWIDADLSEHAATKARAMLSPEALLLASEPGDIAAYLAAQSDADVAFYPVFSERTGGNATVAGYSYAERFGDAGIAIACQRLQRLLSPRDEPVKLVPAPRHVIALLRVIRLAPDRAEAIEAAIAVIDVWETTRQADGDDDPRPLAYELLRGSPALALAALRGQRRAWIKTFTEQLERIDSASRGDALRDMDIAALPPALRAAAPPAPAFFQPQLLPRIAMRDGTVLPLDRLAALAACMAAGDTAALRALRALADPASLAGFCWAVFDLWNTSRGADDGGAAWPLTQLATTGDDEAARRLARLVATWASEHRLGRMVAGIDVLGQLEAEIALVHLGAMAHASDSIKRHHAAWRALEDAAARRALTTDQLLGRAAPDLGLDRDATTWLELGARRVQVGFGAGLEPFVRDDHGKPLKALPRAARTDAREPAAGASARWAAMKDDAHAVAQLQLTRLEIAMGDGRRWTGDELRAFVGRPLIARLVGGLVWGRFDGGRLASAFHIDGERWLDVDGKRSAVAGDHAVGLVHPVHLSRDQRAAWSRQIREPGFRQLDRVLHVLDDGERSARSLTRFDGRSVRVSRLVRLLARGWRQDIADIGDDCLSFVKPVGEGLHARLPISPGLEYEYRDADLKAYEMEQTLGGVTIAPRGSEDAVALGSLDPAVVSEVIADIERIGGTD
jgi:hypothetical protein